MVRLTEQEFLVVALAVSLALAALDSQPGTQLTATLRTLPR